jgi:F-type H+-transporting ATPase subunit delta
MSRRASATPYAKALFEVALAEGRAEAFGQEVATVAGLFRDHRDLQRALGHPAIPQKAKHAVMEQVASQLGLSVPVRKLLLLMADRDRLMLLPELEQAYQVRLLRHLRIVEAHVTTAVALTPDRADALARGLSRATGKDVRLTAVVDPAIMGGVVARMGSTVFDGSVTRQLERLRGELVAGR